MVEVTNELKESLREAGRKIFSLCAPWPLWTISGGFVIETPTAGAVTESNSGGKEILSFVPLAYVADFLSPVGQSIVSHPKLYHIHSILMYDLNNSQVVEAMLSLRSLQINRVRSSASLIFGPGFPQEWFPSQFNRGSVEKLQTLLSPYMTPSGKKYDIFPPVLFPNGSNSRKSDIFLNPALIRASKFYYFVSTTHTNTAQILKVMLFGPTSLADDKTRSGPKPLSVLDPAWRVCQSLCRSEYSPRISGQAGFRTFRLSPVEFVEDCDTLRKCMC